MHFLRLMLRSFLLFVLPTLAVCVAMLEIGLRMTGRLPSNTTEGLFEQHGNAYRLRKNLTKVSRTPSFTCTIHTNDCGLRDKAPGPRQYGAREYYAFVGDSITFANGVDYEDSFVGAFGELASKQGREVADVAVGGYRFTDEEELLADFLKMVKKPPSHVMLVLTVGGLVTFEQLYDDVLIKDGYIFSKRGWVLPYVTVMLGNASSAYVFFRDGARKLQGRYGPPAPKVALELLSPYSRQNPLLAQPAAAARLETRLSRDDQLIRAAGAIPVYIYMPSSTDLRLEEYLSLAAGNPVDYDFRFYNDLLKRHCEKSGIRFIDLTPPLRALKDKGVNLSFAQDPHYTPEVNRAIGRFLYDAIVGTGTTGPI